MDILKEQLDRTKELMEIISEQTIDAEALWQGQEIPSPTTVEGKMVLKKALHHLVDYVDGKEGAPGNFHIFLCHSLNSDPEGNTNRIIEEAGGGKEELKKFPWSLILLYLCSARDIAKGNWKNGEYQWDHLDAKFPEFFGAEEVEAELEEGEDKNVDLSQPNKFEKELR